jgi:hypothetical protein
MPIVGADGNWRRWTVAGQRVGFLFDAVVVNANPHQAASREFKCRRLLAGRR